MGAQLSPETPPCLGRVIHNLCGGVLASASHMQLTTLFKALRPVIIESRLQAATPEAQAIGD